MRTFAQNPRAAQQTTPAKSTISGRAHFGQSLEASSIIHLQRTIGNQAVQRMLQTRIEEISDGLTGTVSRRFDHDFSRILLYPLTGRAKGTKLAINKPADEYEREADHIAEQVMRMPDPGLPSRTKCAPLTISRLCASCEDEEPMQRSADKMAHMTGPLPNGSATAAIQRTCAKCEEEEARGTVQTERDPLTVAEGSLDVQAAARAARQGGELLPASTKDFFEPRFGHDFSHVRVHADGEAADAARAVRARAYTLGSHIVFGCAEYAPATAEGKRLLAHELTHVVQQGAAEVKPTAQPASGDRNNQVVHAQQGGGRAMLQRDVVIEPTPDAADPAHNMPVEDQRGIVRTLVKKLCSGFDVPASSPLRVEGGDSTCKDIQNGTSPPHTGCCCLCVLTAPQAGRWTIIISQNESPHTNPASRIVVINPSGSPIESLHWTDASGAGERMISRPRVITFGHELCGHAALIEIGSHSAWAARETSDVHDPAIKTERLIWGEQGLPPSERRGLAAGGPHRGESVYRLTLDGFPLNGYDVRLLPASEQAELGELKRFASSRNWFIEVHGHSDHAGSSTAKQNISDRRAAAVRSDLAAAPNGSNYTFVTIVGHSDSQPIAGASASQLRRVDVILSLFRAGVPTPPPTSPVTHVGPGTPARHSANLTSANTCIRHLATEAWT